MKTLLTIIFILFAGIAQAAQIVCIAEGTLRPGINNIGDIVSIQPDGHIDPKGVGYAHMAVYQVKGTVKEVRAELAKKLPDTSSLSDTEIKERLSTPKYRHKVVNSKQTTIKDMCDTNVILPDAVEIEK
ncbi:hypothetical protein DRQ25_06290 [Candidatus Fermentibacteria bacterium]|nr:MAG: hypothetical protein DRQ25_06290 [Candidatus Fermentibacteria bacterium]